MQLKWQKVLPILKICQEELQISWFINRRKLLSKEIKLQLKLRSKWLKVLFRNDVQIKYLFGYEIILISFWQCYIMMEIFISLISQIVK